MVNRMNDLEKLRVILPHWIEHNNGHGQEFAKWADNLSSSGEKEIAALLKKAQSFLNDADDALKEALKIAGGPLEGSSHHHHHDHHHDH